MITGITQERVVNSSPLKSKVNLAKGYRRTDMFFRVFHSLAAKSSQPRSSNMTFNLSFTSSIRLINRKVELHLVGQSLINFFPDNLMSCSVAFVEEFTFLTIPLVCFITFLNLSTSSNLLTTSSSVWESKRFYLES